MSGRGALIAFEGGDGSGKSTQAARLAGRIGALLTREPGGTPVGERVRAVLLDPEVAALDARAEALLMAAARAQHVAQVIVPTLSAGRPVVTDRYVHSSLAYQGYGRGLDLSDLERLSRWAVDGAWPDLVVLLDVDPATSARRRAGVRPDRLEAESGAFHDRVRSGYLVLASHNASTFRVVDGRGPVDDVGVAVDAVVDGWLRDWQP